VGGIDTVDVVAKNLKGRDNLELRIARELSEVGGECFGKAGTEGGFLRIAVRDSEWQDSELLIARERRRSASAAG